LGSYPYGHRAYPRCPHSQLLRRRRIRSLAGCRGLSAPKHPISISTTPSTWAEIYLRVVSRGTSYFQFRLAFHPYTQVIQAICTSALVRTSTLLSKGFILPTHRSTGFGYRFNDFREHTASLTPYRAADIRFPCGFAIESLNLAIEQNSLARFSKRTTRHCSTSHDASSL
jgi:hypothetical protein